MLALFQSVDAWQTMATAQFRHAKALHLEIALTRHVLDQVDRALPELEAAFVHARLEVGRVYNVTQRLVSIEELGGAHIDDLEWQCDSG